MKQDRRRFLATTAAVGSIGLAGCLGVISGSSSPKYESDQKEEMLLSVDAFPSGWKRNDELNENFDGVFMSEDESLVVLLSIEVYEEVGQAKESHETSESGFSDTNEIDIGNEAFWTTRNDEIAYTIFRHSNALGQAAAIQESGVSLQPDQSRSQKYAREMYSHWEEL
ncbi:hypothetical protein PNP85_12410 [Halobacterium salinarum]|uniref:hypothetical protein n=1 Tax=Halobacterium salinarum TaxID=2242 RepID=UPI002553C811|nr:hypothetical protein [Halobacterium salinarum]MDL0140305.1 hypothetical protein [Halobacterium salinarum]